MSSFLIIFFGLALFWSLVLAFFSAVTRLTENIDFGPQFSPAPSGARADRAPLMMSAGETRRRDRWPDAGLGMPDGWGGDCATCPVGHGCPSGLEFQPQPILRPLPAAPEITDRGQDHDDKEGLRAE